MQAKQPLKCVPSVLVAMAIGLTALNSTLSAQDTATQFATPRQNSQDDDIQSTTQSLSVELRELQIKVAELEAALRQDHRMALVNGSPNDASSDVDPNSMQMGTMGDHSMSTEMGMMPNMDGMGMGNMKTTGQGMAGMRMSGIKMDGMGMMGQHPGMRMMGQMQSMSSLQMAAALPGFPGASHLYHIGATAFFLDHPQHISLTVDQQQKLNVIKENTWLGQATYERWIAQAEQEIWVLTSADVPDAAQIEAKVREIAKINADKRLAYIQAVGEAARVLTDDQRKALVGQLPPQHLDGGEAAK